MAKAPPQQAEESGLSIIDCDVHQSYAVDEELVEYLPDRYKSRGIVLPELLYRSRGQGSRPDSFPDEVDVENTAGYDSVDVYAGSDYESMRDNFMDKHGVDYSILTHQTDLTINGIPNRDYAFELAKAVNKWVLDTWIPKDERFMASLLVAMESPEKSAEMIREMGDHPRVAQVLIQGAAGRDPFGQPKYWPVYEAADEMDLPISVHLSSTGAGITNPVTAAGQPTNSVEWATLVPAVYQGFLASIVAEGVLAEFPDLQFALVEGGYSWVPGFMWRMDNVWKGARDQVPWLEKPPSEYIYDQVRFTTQPAHFPEDPRNLTKLLESFRAEEVLMYSSDYPHHDTDEPQYALPPGLPEETRERIYYKNAQEFFGLPDDPADI